MFVSLREVPLELQDSSALESNIVCSSWNLLSFNHIPHPEKKENEMKQVTLMIVIYYRK
jgi:hypothetical protein